MKKLIPSVLLAVLLSLGLLSAAIWLPATSSRLMCALMARFAPPETTGLPAEDYPAMTKMITGYLRGGNEPFQYTYTLDGTDYLAFHDYEQQHMDDVQGLFRLCRFVMWLGTGAVLLWGFALRGRQRWFSLRVMQGTLLTLLAAVTVLAVVAVIDFDALFILFHKVAFTNDLWLLDPRTDMLIRLMPTDFFVTYAAIIGCLWLLGMVGLLVISAIPSAKQKKGSEIP
ncbi:MAG: TIGR01906 family membrane protein [Clostridia bacterium]|nr:TIGR01906 family membrane protein [Clostridia bacterium]